MPMAAWRSSPGGPASTVLSPLDPDLLPDVYLADLSQAGQPRIELVSAILVDGPVVVDGQVAATRRQTRDDKPFVIVTLELMDGSIDVFVWQNRLRDTEHLWTAGTLVLVSGGVRVLVFPPELADSDSYTYMYVQMYM